MSLLEDEANTYQKNLVNYRNNRTTQKQLRSDMEASLDAFAQQDAHGRDFSQRPIVTDGTGTEPHGFSDYYDTLSEKNYVNPPFPLPNRPQVMAFLFKDTETPTQMQNDEGYSLFNKKLGVQ